jgi:two-component system, OmpR family, response regulator
MISQPARILVVDDETATTETVATALRYEGFAVAEAATGRAALEDVALFRPDLVVLDVELPDLDGFEVTRRLRQQGVRIPVLFLSARDATEDKIHGLTIGADDYMTKPFSLGEIIARVRAVLRRAGYADNGCMLRFDDLVMDEETHEVFRAGSPIHLTATEFALLRYFLLNPRRVLSKSQILDHLWPHEFDGGSNLVETFISSLRKKIDRCGPPLIQTIRLVGYTLRLPEE